MDASQPRRVPDSRSRGQRAFNLISCPRLARTRIIIHCQRLGTRAVLSVLPLLLPLRSPNTTTRRGRPFRRISYRLPRGRRRWGPGGIAAARACTIDRIQTVGSGPSRGQASRGVVVQSEWGRCTHGAWANGGPSGWTKAYLKFQPKAQEKNYSPALRLWGVVRRPLPGGCVVRHPRRLRISAGLARGERIGRPAPPSSTVFGPPRLHPFARHRHAGHPTAGQQPHLHRR